MKTIGRKNMIRTLTAEGKVTLMLLQVRIKYLSDKKGDFWWRRNLQKVHFVTFKPKCGRRSSCGCIRLRGCQWGIPSMWRSFLSVFHEAIQRADVNPGSCHELGWDLVASSQIGRLHSKARSQKTEKTLKNRWGFEKNQTWTIIVQFCYNP